MLVVMIAIQTSKEKRMIKGKLKEKIKSAPKKLVGRGLDDGAKHLWGQFREAAQRGQANDCGGNRTKDTAARGANQTRRGMEHLLKKKKSARGRKRDGKPHTDDPSAPPGDPEGMLSLPLRLGANTLVGRVSTPRPRLCAGGRVREHLTPGLCRRADGRSVLKTARSERKTSERIACQTDKVVERSFRKPIKTTQQTARTAQQTVKTAQKSA